MFLKSLFERQSMLAFKLYACTLSIGFLGGVYALLVFLFRELDSEDFRNWMKRRTGIVAVVLLISAFNLPSVEIIVAGIPGLVVTNAPLDSSARNYMRTMSLVSLFLETLPKLSVQIILFYSSRIMELSALLALFAVVADAFYLLVVGLLHVFILKKEIGGPRTQNLTGTALSADPGQALRGNIVASSAPPFDA